MRPNDRVNRAFKDLAAPSPSPYLNLVAIAMREGDTSSYDKGPHWSVSAFTTYNAYNHNADQTLPLLDIVDGSTVITRRPTEPAGDPRTDRRIASEDRLVRDDVPQQPQQ